ncbi:type I pullulanase [Streptococcus oricebi]|uniref:pullulanase n=1 Tax=Streptococcus oricebi TaxID=1547447 RepID=A0ABS5B2H5_9STRE|nr:type I pullulanase [Streptococcus oricebi]MBP2623022.1 type I pullulanase [Streptococcus oricebi]
MLNYRVLVHYHNHAGDYQPYDMWQWQKDELGREVQFAQFDYFGRSGTLSYQSEHPLDYVHLIVKKTDWSSQSVDYTIRLLPAHLVTEVWLIEGDDQVYYSKQAAMTSHAYYHRNPHAFDMALHYRDFDRHWAYQDWLGYRYQEKETSFKLWAPTASKVELLLYKDSSKNAPIWKVYPLERGQIFSYYHKNNTIGVWSKTVQEDLKGRAYQYRLTFDYEEVISRDPYSDAATADGKRSVILSPKDRELDGFQVKHGTDAPWRLDNPCQAVIYEMHLRDFSQSETSGVDPQLRGTILGACQKGTKNKAGQATTFDYIKELGVNYIQLQPVADRHKDYDENGQVTYNWGYDPQNYNVVESSFSSQVDDPGQVVRDFKTLVQAYHDAGIGVILDVVYNHSYSTFDSPFQATVPDYYYRMNLDGSFQNGTGVGSETASEHEMFRKYMIDSLLYWVEEYNVDGFRFDLMGIHDVETMQMIRDQLDKIDPRILTYGEGWDMGSGLLPQDKAKKDNAYQLLDIGFFNDNQRDAIKGAEVFGGLKAGFVSGQGTENIIAKAILGSGELGSYLMPNQVVNYVEAHDNYNLHDLLAELHPYDDLVTRTKRVELATAMNILMQGLAFIELGQEFLRTKLVATGPEGQLTEADKTRAMNSYNAPDAVNQVDWDLLGPNQASKDFIRQIIQLKTSRKEFSYPTYEEIYQHVYVRSAQTNSGLVIFEIRDERDYLVIFNASGLPYYLEEADKLRLIAGNSRTKRPFYVEDLTASVFEIVK